MMIYQNYSGHSSVVAFSLGSDYIDVQFSDYSIYRYSYRSAGVHNVEEMKKLAIKGIGLNSYIIRYCRILYERKIR